MDEREWLACEDPLAMLRFVSDKASDRRFQLLATACLRCRFRVGRRGIRAELIQAAEDYADHLIAKRKLHVHWPAGRGVRSWAESPRRWASELVGKHTRRLPQEAKAGLVRDIFGNIFRPIACSPAWRTPAVLALATAAYDNRFLPAGTLEPDRLAVLADALEDAGCTDPELLGHLRSNGPHVRGCWAVDLVMGRE